jgi:glutamate synthase domain-containing protein 1
MKDFRLPEKQGLYDPQFEHDSCGVGFVCNIKGEKSNLILRQGIEVLHRLAHRGAVGADPKTGDGAGILIQMPHAFFKKAALETGITLPGEGNYGTGLVFLPQDDFERGFCKEVFDKAVKELGQVLLGWRKVPIDNSCIGESAKATQPVFEQVFIARNAQLQNDLDFERKLYCLRKHVENQVRASEWRQKKAFYITNLSCRTFSYK